MKCPHCEKEMELTPLQTLKLHIKTRIKNLEMQKKRREGWKNPNPEHIKAAQRGIDKWQSWLKAINDLETKQQTPN